MSALAYPRNALPIRLHPALKHLLASDPIERLRRRVATEIDGTIAQDLESILALFATASPCAIQSSHIRVAFTAAEQGLVFARQLIQQLRHSEGALREKAPDVPIGSALQVAMDRVLARAGIALFVHCDRSLSLPNTVAHEIVHIACEAAANAVKHAAAKSVVCSVTAHNHGLTLDIKDDGVGFDPSVSSTGFGLLGLTERARSIGAVLTIKTRVGEGTVVALHCALQADEMSVGANLHPPRSNHVPQ
jgi:signal transduction histidine kinase